MKALPSLLFAATAVALSTAQAAPKTWDWRAALDYALEHSPTLDSARQTQSIRELEATTAWTRLLPSLDLSATHGVGSSSQGTAASPFTSNVGVTATETLWNGGEQWTRIASARQARELASLQAQRAREQLCYDVLEKFTDYSYAARTEELRKQQYEVLLKQAKQVTALYRQGLKPQKDYLRFNADVQRSELDWVVAQNATRIARAELKKTMGFGYLQIQPSDDSVSFTPIGEAPKQARFPVAAPPFSGTLDFKISEVQAELNRVQRTLSTLDYLPQLFVGASISPSYSGYMSPSPALTTTNSLSWSATVGLRYNLWDWRERYRNLDIADATQRVSDNAVEVTRQTLLVSLTSLMSEIDRVARGSALANQRLTLSEESFVVLDNEYRQGKIAYLDLVTGLNDLIDSRLRWARVSYDGLLRLAQYRFYEGRLHDRLRVDPSSKKAAPADPYGLLAP